MADLEDLGYKSISEMSSDEAIEYLRQVRLSRRVPVKTKATKSSKKTNKATAPAKLTSSQAADLLKLLEETE